MAPDQHVPHRPIRRPRPFSSGHVSVAARRERVFLGGDNRALYCDLLASQCQHGVTVLCLSRDAQPLFISFSSPPYRVAPAYARLDGPCEDCRGAPDGGEAARHFVEIFLRKSKLVLSYSSVAGSKRVLSAETAAATSLARLS